MIRGRFFFSRSLRILATGGAILLLQAIQPASAKVNEAISAFDGSENAMATLPKLLSQTNLYTAMARGNSKPTLTEGIIGFEVNAPLWSDGTHKSRWVQIPSGKIRPTTTDRYRFPDKTVFIKNFAIDTTEGDSLTRINIETRFLVVRHLPSKSGSGRDTVYAGISYQWKRDQSDAVLVDQNFGADTSHVVNWRKGRWGKAWRYPSKDDCNQCHMGRGVLGLSPPSLNRPDKAKPTIGQLQALVAKGLLTADPTGGKRNFFRWYGANDMDSGATSELKARSYFGANCSHCHGNNASVEGASHDFDFLTKANRVADSTWSGYYGGQARLVQGGISAVDLQG